MSGRIPSIIEATRQPLAAAPADPGTAWRSIDFTMQPQSHTRWCWAAVAASLAAYFSRRAETACPWTQCTVANAALARADCCTETQACNVDAHLADVLGAIDLSPQRIPNPVPLEDIQRELDAARPVCLHIDWGNGSGHFIATVGYHGEPPMLAIEDPYYGSLDVDFDTFRQAYRGGTWDHTYYVNA